MSKRKRIYEKSVCLISSLIICLAAGAAGSLFTASSVDNWYASLDKPTFNPPSWVFGPVWTLLYIMMGFSLFLARISTRAGTKARSYAMIFFTVQLLLNAGWSGLFFGLQSPVLGFIGIILLWAAIAATIHYFRKLSTLAAGLLYPYLAWVTFAAILNYYIMVLN